MWWPVRILHPPPVARIKGGNVVTLRLGESITLDASESSDPDGEGLKFKWIHYPEAGTYFHWRGNRGIIIENSDSAITTLTIPMETDVLKPYTTHIILQVTDTGTPSFHFYNILPIFIPHFPFTNR